jgi:hypothetical protein
MLSNPFTIHLQPFTMLPNLFTIYLQSIYNLFTIYLQSFTISLQPFTTLYNPFTINYNLHLQSLTITLSKRLGSVHNGPRAIALGSLIEPLATTLCLRVCVPLR